MKNRKAKSQRKLLHMFHIENRMTFVPGHYTFQWWSAKNILWILVHPRHSSNASYILSFYEFDTYSTHKLWQSIIIHTVMPIPETRRYTTQIYIYVKVSITLNSILTIFSGYSQINAGLNAMSLSQNINGRENSSSKWFRSLEIGCYWCLKIQ